MWIQEKGLNRLLRKVLEDPDIGKMAHNAPFEDGWIAKCLRARVRPWLWCSANASQWLDNRNGVHGLKFQAFVRFGILDYSSDIEPFLRGRNPKDGNSFNRIDKVDPKKLMVYCGMDAMLEHRLALLQMKEGGFKE